MKSIETQITIEAGPDQVWAVLMDFESYQHWNPFLISVKGSPVVGTQLDNEIKTSGNKVMKFQPEVLVVEEQKEFRWKGKMFVKGLFDGEHYFKLKQNNDGSTRLIHGENFTGMLTGWIMKMIGEDTVKGFEAMNNALKIRVETMRRRYKMQSDEKKLRWVLKGNAAFSLISGTTIIIAHKSLADFMEVTSPNVLLFVGIGLVLFSATVFQAGLRKSISPKQIKAIIIQDWAWVAGSTLIIALEAWGLSAMGYWTIAGVALLVADFAIFQMRFLKRLA